MSKRKPLLTESELRRFMTLANMGPVGTGRLSEMGYPPAQREEEELDSELHATEDELGAEDHEADLEGDELAVDDTELDAEGPVGGEEEDLVMSLLQAIQGWAEENGVDMDLEGGEEDIGGDELEGGEEEIELGGEEELPGGGELEMDAEVEEPMMETGKKKTGASKGDKGKDKKDPEDRDYSGHGMRKGDESDTDPGDKDDTWRKGEESKTHAGLNKESKVVEEVAKRVIARLQAENNKEKMVDQLAERIMKRLTK